VADDIDARLDDWEARLDRLESDGLVDASAPAPAEPSVEHLLFVPAPSGYVLVERTGSAPAPGDVLELEEQDVRYTVSRVVRSPLPGDDRLCAYVAAI
jgi:hypothetical protein